MDELVIYNRVKSLFGIPMASRQRSTKVMETLPRLIEVEHLSLRNMPRSMMVPTTPKQESVSGSRFRSIFRNALSICLTKETFDKIADFMRKLEDHCHRLSRPETWASQDPLLHSLSTASVLPSACQA